MCVGCHLAWRQMQHRMRGTKNTSAANVISKLRRRTQNEECSIGLSRSILAEPSGGIVRRMYVEHKIFSGRKCNVSQSNGELKWTNDIAANNNNKQIEQIAIRGIFLPRWHQQSQTAICFIYYLRFFSYVCWLVGSVVVVVVTVNSIYSSNSFAGKTLAVLHVSRVCFWGTTLQQWMTTFICCAVCTHHAMAFKHGKQITQTAHEEIVLFLQAILDIFFMLFHLLFINDLFIKKTTQKRKLNTELIKTARASQSVLISFFLSHTKHSFKHSSH